MVAVIDHLDPDGAVTAEGLYQRLVAEMACAPSLHEVRTALEILAMPHLGFTPGETSGPVLERMRIMLIEDGGSLPDSDATDDRF